MILLLGGTTETALIADALAEKGVRILVSTLTDTPQNTGTHPGIERRTGALDAEGMEALILKRGIAGVVDATHPYAAQVTATAHQVCTKTGTPYYRFDRPGHIHAAKHVKIAPDHATAAQLACQSGGNVLLTIGSRHLEPYVEAAKLTGATLFARVLPCDDSLDKCRVLGIPDDQIIAARGPFSAEENARTLAELDIDVLVTKDSGEAGGVPQKIEAAAVSGRKVIVVARPAPPAGAAIYHDVHKLVNAVADKAGIRIGTTSFILRDDILPNVQFLADTVDDVELLVFEYAERSPLPSPETIASLAGLGCTHDLTYTVHLPLNAHIGSADEVARKASVATHLAVMRRFDPLRPHGYILHAEREDKGMDQDRWSRQVDRSIAEMIEAGIQPDTLCVETLDYPFEWIESVVEKHGLSICLDVGHILLQGANVIEHFQRYGSRTTVVHLHAVADGKDHKSLDQMDPALLDAIVEETQKQQVPDRVVTLELFHRDRFEASLSILKEKLS